MIYEIETILKSDSYINEFVENRIKAYRYPKPEDIHAPHIIIDPLDVPLPSDYADNVWMTDDYLYQIEVWAHDYAVVKEVSRRIRLALWDLGFSQGEGIDEYDDDFKLYRDARRYRGKAYRQDLDSL